jgi:hypothetical protein
VAAPPVESGASADAAGTEVGPPATAGEDCDGEGSGATPGVDADVAALTLAGKARSPHPPVPHPVAADTLAASVMSAHGRTAGAPPRTLLADEDLAIHRVMSRHRSAGAERDANRTGTEPS